MPLPVKLEDVADAMDAGSGDEMTAYINVKTGEIHTVLDLEELSLAFDVDDEESGLDREVLEKDAAVEADEDFIELPDRHDIHEYRIMEDFVESLNDRPLRDKLSREIQGRGAFGRFKNGVYQAGIEKNWFAFRDAAMKKIAADFLEGMEIPFIDNAPAENAASAITNAADPDEDMIADLEQRLLKPKTRKSWQKSSALLDDGFVEFGSSGKTLNKIDILDALQAEAEAGIPKRSFTDLKVHKLAPEVALVTYRCRRHASGDVPERHSLRSSVWALNDGRWQMLFHQGTPATPDS